MSDEYRTIFKNNLNRLLQEQGKKQIDLARYLGINRATVSAWCHGTRYPRPEAIEKIAAFFHVSTSDLVADQNDRVEEDRINVGIRVPVLGNVAGGIPIDEIEDVEDYVYVDPRLTYGSDIFSLKIKGHSMEPDIKNGDIVVVRQQPSVENGQIAVVSVAGYRGTCKIFKKSEDGITLLSINPDYDPIIIPRSEANDVRILGKVVQVIRNIN